MSVLDNRRNLLFPLMVLAALSVILFSLVGIATMTGHLPAAFSKSEATTAPTAGDQALRAAEAVSPAASKPTAASARPTAVPVAAAPCLDCGVVESIRASEAKAAGSGVGAVAGGVTGGVIGNQIGGGSGRVIATVVGAAGGAYLGNEIEKNVKKSTVYQVTVRMEDGSTRTVTESAPPAYRVGEKVKIVDGRLAARG
ncbi:MAG: glycine zipper 2TM domain-containing protein [Pseudomonadota bacterium]